MYSKLDLIENEKLNKAIKENKVKYRKLLEQRRKKELISNVILTISASTFFIGLMVLIAVIENLNF